MTEKAFTLNSELIKLIKDTEGRVVLTITKVPVLNRTEKIVLGKTNEPTTDQFASKIAPNIAGVFQTRVIEELFTHNKSNPTTPFACDLRGLFVIRPNTEGDISKLGNGGLLILRREINDPDILPAFKQIVAFFDMAAKEIVNFKVDDLKEAVAHAFKCSAEKVTHHSRTDGTAYIFAPYPVARYREEHAMSHVNASLKTLNQNVQEIKAKFNTHTMHLGSSYPIAGVITFNSGYEPELTKHLQGLQAGYLLPQAIMG